MEPSILSTVGFWTHLKQNKQLKSLSPMYPYFELLNYEFRSITRSSNKYNKTSLDSIAIFESVPSHVNVR